MFINSSQNYSAQLRQEGFCQTLSAAGINLGPEWIRSVRIGQRVEDILGAALEEGLDPTAIFCFCDQMAIDAMQELKQRGIRIPDDIAVMGVDNLSVGGMLAPSLTTIDVQNSQMGIGSAQILLRKIQERSAHLAQVNLTPRLIARAST